jgi:hypothetical protein
MLDNNPNENLINSDLNSNDKKEILHIEKKAAKTESDNDIEVKNSEMKENTKDNKGIINNSKENIDNNNKELDNGEIIIETIEKTDSTDFLHPKEKKKKENDKKEIYFEGDSDLNSQIKGRNKYKFNNHKYHMFISLELLKKLTLVIIIIYILIAISSCIVFDIRRNESPFLFCFKFIERNPDSKQDTGNKDAIYFLTDLNSFIIIHLVFLSIFMSVCYLLIKGEQSEIVFFFDNMSIFFHLTLLFNIPILFIGMFTYEFYSDWWRPIIYLIFTFFSFLCMIKIYLVAKIHSYKNILSLINISILSSFMTAYQCYCFLFCLCYFVLNFPKPENKIEEIGDNQEDNYFVIEIIAGFIYFCFGVTVMTVFKDIFFVIAMVNIESGLLYIKRASNYCLLITLFNIGFLSLNFASIISLILSYKKKIFRLKIKE